MLLPMALQKFLFICQMAKTSRANTKRFRIGPRDVPEEGDARVGALVEPDDGLLADRRVAHPVRAELREQALGQLEHAAGGTDVLTDEHDRWVASHLLGDGSRDGRAIRQFRHDEPPSDQTWVSSTSGDGSGAARAVVSAAVTAAAVWASMASSVV